MSANFEIVLNELMNCYSLHPKNMDEQIKERDYLSKLKNLIIKYYKEEDKVLDKDEMQKRMINIIGNHFDEI